MKNLMILFFLLISSLFVVSGSTVKMLNESRAHTFVLVHGAWQAPYAWEGVKDALIKKGNKVIVVQLPGHGDDTTPPSKISMQLYRDTVVKAIQAANGKVILVGHSMGGLVISAVAESIPEKIDKLVYLGAFLPANGDSLMSLSMTDQQSLLGQAIVPSQDHLTLALKDNDAIVKVFCQDADQKIQKLVTANYKSEPAIPFGDAIALTEGRFGKVNKYYIHTLKDNAVGIDLQNRMVEASNLVKQYSIDSGHLPHLTQPDKLSGIIADIAKE